MILIVFFATALIGGTGAALVKFNIGNIPPFTLVAARSLLALILVTPFAYRSLNINKKKDKKYLLFAGLLFAANWLLFAIGIQYTSVIMGQLIYVPTAVFVAIIGFLFLNEKLTKEQLLGMFFSLFGMSILIYDSLKSQDVLSVGTLQGNLIIVTGMLSWSIYLVVTRKISKIYTPLTIIAFDFLITLLVSFPLAAIGLIKGTLVVPQITTDSIVGLISLVIFSSILFFLLNQWLVKHASAFISSLVLYLLTIFATATGIIFFNEKLTSNFIIGATFVILGVFIATSYKYAKKFIFACRTPGL